MYPDIVYDYPPQAVKNPFDTKAKENYFIWAKGFSYLSDELKYFEEPMNNRLLTIPMGYKTLMVLHRVMIVKNGKVVLEIAEDTDALISLNRHLFSEPPEAEWDKDEGGYVLFTSRGVDVVGEDGKVVGVTYQLAYEVTLDLAEKRAFAASQKDPEAFILVSRLIFHRNWH